MSEEPEQQDEVDEDEASFDQPEPAPEPPVEEQTHNEGGDSEPETD